LIGFVDIIIASHVEVKNHNFKVEH